MEKKKIKTDTKKAPSKKSSTKKNKSGVSSAKKASITLSIVLFLFSVFSLCALGSFLGTWKSDQLFTDLSLLGDTESEAMNACGKIGAWLGNLIIGKWFGFFGVFLPLPLLTFAIFLTGLKRSLFLRLTIITFSGMLILPATLAFFTPFADPAIYGSGLGGGFGNYVAGLLRDSTGVIGTVLILLTAVSLWLIYSIPYSFRWFVSLSHGIKHSADKIGETINNREISIKRHADEEGNERSEIEIVDTDREDNTEEEDEESPFLDAPRSAADEEALRNDPVSVFEKSEPEGFELKVAPKVEPEDVSEETAEESFVSRITDSTREVQLEVVQQFPDEAESPEENTVAAAPERNYEYSVAITDNAVIADGVEIDDTKIEIIAEETIEDEEFDQSVYDPTLELSSFKLPPITLMDNVVTKVTVTDEELRENTKRIVDTLENFSIKVDKIQATIGPTVTLYEIKPAPGVRISTIKRLEDDIALSLSALGIRIVAPIPGKDTVGIEVPNKNKEIVSMYSAIKTTKFQESDADLPIVLGKTIQNEAFVMDLAKLPHLLVAGATGQGKSVGLNAIITSLLYKKHPAELKFVMVDPKKVEFSLYTAIENHYLAKLPDEDESIIVDTQKVIFTLNSLCVEMDTRYDLLKKAKVRNIKEYNKKFKERRLNPHNGHRFLPYFVVIIDEFGDLILTAGKEIETPLTRLAALARAVGIHLVIATQRPTTNIITGSIKANFPARMAFRVISGIDSKTILDTTGANQLIGRGDLLILANNDITRVQCAFIDTHEVERITDYIRSQPGYGHPYCLPEFNVEVTNPDTDNPILSQRDALFDKVARYVVSNQQGSASTIQRNFEIGFNRAGRIMDQLEKAGIVGKQVGSKPRQVLIGDLTSLELHLINIDNPKYNY